MCFKQPWTLWPMPRDTLPIWDTSSPPFNQQVGWQHRGHFHHDTFEGSLRGVKRKSLATALTSSKSGSHHLDWTSGWDSEMPPDLLAKCRPLHCQLCDVQVRDVDTIYPIVYNLHKTFRRLPLCKPRCIIRGKLTTSTWGVISLPSTSSTTSILRWQYLKNWVWAARKVQMRREAAKEDHLDFIALFVILPSLPFLRSPQSKI